MKRMTMHQDGWEKGPKSYGRYIWFKQPVRDVFLFLESAGEDGGWLAIVISCRGIRKEPFDRRRLAREWANSYADELAAEIRAAREASVELESPREPVTAP